MISFRTDVESGVETVELSAAAPNDEGVVASESLALPVFRRAVFFSADRRGPVENWPADANRELPWVVGESFSSLVRDDSDLNRAVGAPNRQGLAALFELEDGRVSAILSVPGEGCVSVLRVEDGGGLAARIVTLGTSSFDGRAPLYAYGTAATPAGAFRRAWQAALDSPVVASHTGFRWEKEYGEPFEYLGWCSWEHFHKDIDATTLSNVIRGLNECGVPVRWALIDDGHQVEEALRLKSLAPNPRKFPDGWDPILSMRTETAEAIRWIGLWHCFHGLWKTLHTDNEFGSLNEYLAELPSGAYVPRGDEVAARRFYDALIGSAAEAGFDFVKIDVQAANLKWYAGTPNAVETSAHNSRALEAAVARDLRHGMINCMAHNALCVFNTSHSSVTRCSIDYHLNDADSISSHIMQSYTNTLWMGWSVWPDHDMFHSSDSAAGRMMAVSKALSAAPIYLSDAPADIDLDVVKPLCLADGRLLRPLAPAAPTPESTFADALNDPIRPYVVVAPLANRCAAVAAYNLVQPDGQAADAPVRSSVGVAEYRWAGVMLEDDAKWPIPAEGLVAYDWYRRRAYRLAGGRPGQAPDSGVRIELSYLEDALILLAPVARGWAVLGREDKYLGPASVTAVSAEDDRLEVSVSEAGPLLVWSDRGAPGSDGYQCEALSAGLYRVAVDGGASPMTVVLRR